MTEVSWCSILTKICIRNVGTEAYFWRLKEVDGSLSDTSFFGKQKVVDVFLLPTIFDQSWVNLRDQLI